MKPSDVRVFQVGDRVVATVDCPQCNYRIQEGDEGIVCETGGELTGVDWGFDVDGHSCGDHCQYGYGWYVQTKDIKLCDVGQDIDEDSFLQVIGMDKTDNA